MILDIESYRKNIRYNGELAVNDDASDLLRSTAVTRLCSLGEMLCNEVDRVRGERDALAARVAVLEGALGPAWEADEGTTPGEWRKYADGGPTVRRPIWFGVDAGVTGPVVCRTGTKDMPNAEEDAYFIAAAVNAVRKAKEVAP